MRTAVVFIILLLLTVGAPAALMQENSGPDADYPPIVVPYTHSIDLTSATNGNDYRIWVALPVSYHTSEQSYPVLYVLDPIALFLSTTEYVRLMAFNRELRELIVVGIGYPVDNIVATGSLRQRDFGFRKDRFLDFISEELFPLIDSTYRTDSTDRGLIGFSLGGEFALYTLGYRSELFNRYLAIDSTTQAGLPALLGANNTTFRESFIGRNVKLFHAIRGTELLSAAIERGEYEGLEAVGLSLGNIAHAQAFHFALSPGISAIYDD